MKLTIDPRKAFPRRFVPKDADMGHWPDIERLGDALLARRPSSPSELGEWLEDASELASCLWEERTARYIAMTSQTDDPAREHAYLTFVQEIEPRAKRLWHRLDGAYLENPHRGALPQYYAILDKRVANRFALFREESVPLEVQEAELKQQYQKVAAAMTVHYRGEERTLQQMARFLEDPDRATREEAWTLSARRRLQDRDTQEDLFDRLRALRIQIAQNAGFGSYRDYTFLRRERFDYGPQECLQFHDAVEAHFVPLASRLSRERRASLEVDRLRPWDLDVDPFSQPPLRPFEKAAELVARCEDIFRRVDPELGEHFRFLAEQNLLDLESRKGKAPGGYQSDLSERRWPFIFMNAVGMDRDVRTLLHEGGHAFNALAAREEPLLDYREPPLEFCEVASMGMEMLSLPHLDVFYPQEEDLARARRERIEDVIRIFPWVATIDAFQHWLYENPKHTPAQRRGAWVATYNRFQKDVDWLGFEDELGYMWHRQLHIFEVPFYYIEYGIAQLGALQVWLRARRNYREAVSRYRASLALGGTRSLPDLFAAAGARFAFDAETIAPLAEALSEELENTAAN